MASPSEKLAGSLELLGRLQNKKGIAVVRASDMTRTHMISETFFLFQFDRLLAGIVDLKSIVRALK